MQGIERVGVVVIGRNEGQRLIDCLESLGELVTRTVYVDSGSTDGSQRVAEELGAHVLQLNDSVRFTAARARNAGLIALCEKYAEVELVQFLDGDCRLADSWIETAQAFLAEQPKVAVVCGRRQEQDRNRNLFHRLTDMEWDTPVGEALACGGDALIRISSFNQVGGYRPEMIAGEEPEMCVRLRQAGFQIWRLDCLMAIHDIRMTRVSQWWKRAFRAGHAYAEGWALHGAPPEKHFRKQMMSDWVWAVIIPILAVLLAVPTYGFSLLIAPFLYLGMAAKIALWRRQAAQDEWFDCFAFGTACIVAKFAEVGGQAKYWRGRWSGSGSTLIEYKD